MNVNAYPTLIGAGGYNQTTALRDRYTSTDQVSNTAEPRTYSTSSDLAISDYSANGDILEVSASSASMYSSVSATTGVAAFNAPESGLDFYNAVIQHLRDTGRTSDANFLQTRVNLLTPSLNSIQTINNSIEEIEDIIAQIMAQFEAHAQELQDMEDNIDAQENYLESLGDLVGALEDAVATEEDRLDELASRLEDVLEVQIERLENILERQDDRFENNLGRRLWRLERRQLRFDTRMGRRHDNEMNRRAQFEDRMSTLVAGSPEYEAAWANENRRRERFDNQTVRRTERFDRRMTRAQNRHTAWYDRQRTRLGNMQDNITQRMADNEAAVDAIRTNSDYMDSLHQRIALLETQQADIEAYIATLQTQFEERQRELEPEMERLEDEVLARLEGELETAIEVRAAHQQIAAGHQTVINNHLEALRQLGWLPNQ